MIEQTLAELGGCLAYVIGVGALWSLGYLARRAALAARSRRRLRSQSRRTPA